MKKLFKPALGVLVLVYVWHAHIVDTNALRAAAHAPLAWLAGLALAATANCLLALRWYCLLRAQSFPLRAVRVVQIHWATAFLSLMLPGSVATDVTKIWYITADAPGRKAAGALAILADRVLGSSVLVVTGALSLLIFSGDLTGAPSLAWLARLLWGMAAVMIGAVALLFRLAQSSEANATALERIWWALDNSLPRWPVLKPPRAFALKIIEALLAYRARPRQVLTAAICSLGAIGATVALCAVESHRLGVPIAADRFWYVIPIVSLAGYFSFLPLGLGVGQVVYFHLFTWMRVPHPELAATLCTLIQIYTLVLNLTGAFAFLASRPRATGAERVHWPLAG